MSPKAILVFCAQALLAQSAFSACAGSFAGNGACNGVAGGYSSGVAGGYGNGYGAGCGYGAAGAAGVAGVSSTGGGLPVSSSSPNGPVGVSVISENAYEGHLSAGGNLPFLGAISIEGALPTAGSGAVSYGCGDGAVAISSEGPASTGILTGQSFAPSASIINQGIGYGQGNAGYGLGNARYGQGNTGYGFGGNAGCGCGNGYSQAGAGYGLAGRGCKNSY